MGWATDVSVQCSLWHCRLDGGKGVGPVKNFAPAISTVSFLGVAVVVVVIIVVVAVVVVVFVVVVAVVVYGKMCERVPTTRAPKVVA